MMPSCCFRHVAVRKMSALLHADISKLDSFYGIHQMLCLRYGKKKLGREDLVNLEFL